MKLHIGVDAATGLVHSLSATGADVSDLTEAHRVLHGGELEAWGDSGCQRVEKRSEHAGSEVRWHVAKQEALGHGGTPKSLRPRRHAHPIAIFPASPVCAAASAMIYGVTRS